MSWDKLISPAVFQPEISADNLTKIFFVVIFIIKHHRLLLPTCIYL